VNTPPHAFVPSEEAAEESVEFGFGVLCENDIGLKHFQKRWRIITGADVQGNGKKARGTCVVLIMSELTRFFGNKPTHSDIPLLHNHKPLSDPFCYDATGKINPLTGDMKQFR
jgi:hypothetical protein